MGAWDDILGIFKDVAPIVTPIAGAVLANKQADKALQSQQAAADKSAEITKEMFDASRADLAPFRGTGVAANKRLSQLMGLDEYNRDDVRAQLTKQFPSLFAKKEAEAEAAKPTSLYDRLGMDPLELELRKRQADYAAQDKLTYNSRPRFVGGNGNMRMDLVLRDFKDGQVNQYTGETFDKNRYLQFLKASEDLQAAYPKGTFGLSSVPDDIRKEFEAEQEAIHRMTYQPSKSKQSFLGRFGAPLMLAGITAGAGLAGAPAAAGNLLKGGVSLSKLATGN